jgi:hypothetical protein
MRASASTSSPSGSRPSHVFRSDVAEHGLGGFCGVSGRAWSIELPDDCRVGCRAGISLSLLEFLGGIICIWLEVLEGRVGQGSCLLAQGDSTSAAGWLRKSNFSDHNHPLHVSGLCLGLSVFCLGLSVFCPCFVCTLSGVVRTLSALFHRIVRVLLSN